MIPSPNLDQAADFIWRTARLLDRQRFAYHFLDGSAAAVLMALQPYQNEDGGFGQALGSPSARGTRANDHDVEGVLRFGRGVDKRRDARGHAPIISSRWLPTR